MGKPRREMIFVALAIASAVFYALQTPFSKLLMDAGVDSGAQAGLLYIGAGMGMAIIFAAKNARGRSKEQHLQRSDAPAMIAVVLLDSVGPLLLMGGLAGSTAETVALLNNFEAVATAIIALLFFHERISGRLWAGIGAITVACVLLSIEPGGQLKVSPASLLVLGAACVWGVQNNLTCLLSKRDPVQICMVNGLGSGMGALLLAFAMGDRLPGFSLAVLAMLLGFVASGLSIVCFIRAQRDLGAARVGAYYAMAPFISVFLAWGIWGQRPGALFLVAFALMVLGSWLSLPSRDDAGAADAGAGDAAGDEAAE